MAQVSSVEPSRQGVPATAPLGQVLRTEPDERRQHLVTLEAALSAQRASIALQQASAAKQATSSAATTHTFVTVPWTDPKPIAGINMPSTSSWPSVTPADCDPVSPGQADLLVRENAEKQGLTPELLRAVIRKESAFYPCAVSPKGAMGLMQLMPATAEMLGVADPFDPGQNVDAGARLLKQMLDRYGGDLSLALSAYNAGPGRVDASGGVPAITETRNYVADILDEVRTPSSSDISDQPSPR